MTNLLDECLAPTRTPRIPNTRLPPGSVDTHVHLFEGRYPLQPDRGYDPPDSTVDHLRHMHTVIGIDRVVFTQPSVYGTDNSAILDGADALNDGSGGRRARAVVAVGLDVSDEELRSMHDRGARGVRINTDNKGGMPIDWSQLPELSRRIAPMGWHLEFLFPGSDIVELAPVIGSLPVPASIGHFAYQPAANGTRTAGFEALLSLLRGGNTWLKISGADRVSAAGPPHYEDVAPLAEAVIETAPERIMWATDWPHPNKFEAHAVPDEGNLVDTLGGWVSDPGLRQQILVDNPAHFYDF